MPKKPKNFESLAKYAHAHRLSDDAKKAEDERSQKEMARLTLVEQRIQAAMERGEFDNLPGQGKPMPLSDNPHMEPGQQPAFNLLQHNGMAPEWIERDKAIRQGLKTAQARLRRAWEKRQRAPHSWQAALERFRADIAALNRQIDALNLIVPALSCQRRRLKVEQEIANVQGEES